MNIQLTRLHNKINNHLERTLDKAVPFFIALLVVVFLSFVIFSFATGSAILGVVAIILCVLIINHLSVGRW